MKSFNYSRFLIAIMIVTAVSACGLKRPLELPGHERYKYKTQDQKDAADKADTEGADDGAPDASAPSTTPAAPATH